MFLILGHHRLEAFSFSRKLVKECYRITKQFPTSENFALISQIKRAALSVHLNIAEGASRSSIPERRRYFEIARGSVIEIDAALDIADDAGYLATTNLEDLGHCITSLFKMLSKLIKP